MLDARTPEKPGGSEYLRDPTCDKRFSSLGYHRDSLTREFPNGMASGLLDGRELLAGHLPRDHSSMVISVTPNSSC
jgi:hypothetical protein